MGKNRSESGPLKEISFHCRACWNAAFKAEPARVEDAPDLDHHPFRYFANCPECGSECEQAGWERALLKAWTKATGPKTEAGKARVAQNLEGHPTPEEALRTRFNALSHGAYARTAHYFPARPGKYAQCEGCEHRELTCHSQTACLKRVELFMRHHIAFEARDPELLMQLRADTQASLQAIIDEMIYIIAADGGPRIMSPEWYYDPTGQCHLVKFTDASTGEQKTLMKAQAHPLLKYLMEFIQKNSMSLADMGMTPRVQEEADVVRGNIESQKDDRQTLLEHQARQTRALEALGALIARSQDKTKRDPILIEHGEQQS